MAWLRHNLGFKLLALALSLGLWAYVHVEEGQLQRSITDVIEIRNLPSSLIPRLKANQVRVIVEGPANRLDSLTAEDVDTWVDLKGTREGRQRLSVKCEMNRDTDVLSCRVNPGVVSVELAPRVSKSVPVKVIVSGAPPLGFVFENPRASPGLVTVSGLKKEVDRVARVVAGIPARSLVEGREVDEMARVVPLDTRGAPVRTVEVEPQQARVQSPLHVELASKRLIANPIFTGRVPPRYKVTGVTVRPRSVVARGQALTLSNLVGITTRPIPLDNIETSRTMRAVPLESLAGIVLQPETVNVMIEIEPIQGPMPPSEVTPAPEPSSLPSPALAPNPTTGAAPSTPALKIQGNPEAPRG